MVERYLYDPYGKATVLDEGWQPVTNNESAFANTILYGGYGLDAESGLYHTDWREYHCSLGRFVQVDPAGDIDGSNMYQYCRSSPLYGTDPTGLVDWAKFQEGMWGGGQGMTDFLLGMGAGNDLTRDSQGMVNGEADFLSGLLTAAEGLTDNPAFGQVRDAINSARNLANNGMMAMAAFGSIKGLKGVGSSKAVSSARLTSSKLPAGANATKGWKVGDPINNLTSKGNVPSWDAVRKRYWKNQAHNNPGKYSQRNLDRMRKGLAEQRRNKLTGEWESMHLHHDPPQSAGGLFDFTPMSPPDHFGIH